MSISNWITVDCPYCHAIAGAFCCDPPDAKFKADRSVKPHPTRHRLGVAAAHEQAQRKYWESSAGREEARRQHEAWSARQASHDARRAEQKALQEKRDKKREAGGYNWSDEDPVGVKRQRLVSWLMTQGVALGKAKLIASRKYRY